MSESGGTSRASTRVRGGAPNKEQYEKAKNKYKTRLPNLSLVSVVEPGRIALDGSSSVGFHSLGNISVTIFAYASHGVNLQISSTSLELAFRQPPWLRRRPHRSWRHLQLRWCVWKNDGAEIIAIIKVTGQLRHTWPLRRQSVSSATRPRTRSPANKRNSLRC